MFREQKSANCGCRKRFFSVLAFKAFQKFEWEQFAVTEIHCPPNKGCFKNMVDPRRKPLCLTEKDIQIFLL